jgi:hypothetical protein
VLIYIPDEDKALKYYSSSYDQVNSQLSRLKADIKAAENDMEYLRDETYGIINNEKSLKNCLLDKRLCADLPESWKS